MGIKVENIKFNDLNKKKIFGYVIVFLIALWGSVFNFGSHEIRQSEALYDGNRFPSNILENNSTIVQELQIDHGISAVEFLCATHTTEITNGEIDVKLLEDGNCLYEMTLPATAICDNRYLSVDLPDSIEYEKDAHYSIQLYFSGIEGQMICFWLTDQYANDEYALTINGQEEAFDIVSQYGESYKEYGIIDIRKTFFSVCLILLLIFFRRKREISFSFTKPSRRFVSTTCISVLCAAGISWFLTQSGMFFKNTSSNLLAAVIFISILCGMTLIWNYKLFEEKIHFFSAFIIISIGMCYLVSMPWDVSNSWDEHIHFLEAAYLAEGAKGELPQYDLVMASSVQGRQNTDYLSEDARSNMYEKGDLLYSADDKIYYRDTLSNTSIAYIPAAIALFFSRILNVSYKMTLFIGKFANLLVYAVIISIAIYELEKNGKLLLLILSIMPVQIFLASSFSYDWWVNAFTILSYSVFWGRLQRKGKISNRDLVLVLALIVIGILPKPVYFPLILPFAFLPGRFYEDAKKARICVVIALVVACLPMIVPSGVRSISHGDTRGGNDINGGSQIGYILAHPVAYTKTLLRFLIDYLSVDNAAYINYLAYRGFVRHRTFMMILLGVLAVYDNKKMDTVEKKTYAFRGCLLVMCFGAVCLAATSMYVVFTAVGADTIIGCQPRYIWPVVFPFLLCVPSGLAVRGKNSYKYVGIVACLSMIFINGQAMYDLVLRYY